jgi:hypothetical protein
MAIKVIAVGRIPDIQIVGRGISKSIISVVTQSASLDPD